MTEAFVDHETFHLTRQGEYRGLPPLKLEAFDISQCIVRPLPDYILNWRGPKARSQFAVVIDNVLTPRECMEWIQATENKGYEEALVNVGGGKQVLLTDYRKSSRCIIDDELRVAEIWNRIQSFIPTDLLLAEKGVIPSGLNERLRFLRYDPGDYFNPHCDGSYQYPPDHPTRANEESYITFQLYLNEGFEGGATRFFTDYNEQVGYDVIPKTGSVLLFEHRMFHEGSLLVKGRKYAVRTDISFKLP